MTNNWPTKKLGEVCSKSTGIAYKSPDFTEKSSGSVPVILLRDFDHPFYTEKYLTNLDRYSNHVWVETGDILISKTSDIKLCVWKGPKSVLNQNAMRLRVNKSEIEKNLVLYFLRIKINELRGLLVGGTIRFVKEGEIMGQEMPIPPPQTQRAIVKRLDAIRKAQELNEKQISLADELFRSLLHQELKPRKDWEYRKVREICSIKGGKRIPKGKRLTETKTPHPYIRVIDFKDFSVDLKNLMFIDEEVFKVIKNYTISKDDVYISIAGTTGLVGSVPEKLDGANLTENAARLVIKSNNIEKMFLVFYLTSSYAQIQIRRSTYAPGVPKLALKRLGLIRIQTPPLKTQRQVAKKLSAVQEYKKKLLKQKKLFQEFFESTLNKAMKGELAK